jgi:hypothetical protein
MLEGWRIVVVVVVVVEQGLVDSEVTRSESQVEHLITRRTVERPRGTICASCPNELPTRMSSTNCSIVHKRLIDKSQPYQPIIVFGCVQVRLDERVGGIATILANTIVARVTPKSKQ